LTGVVGEGAVDDVASNGRGFVLAGKETEQMDAVGGSLEIAILGTYGLGSMVGPVAC